MARGSCCSLSAGRAVRAVRRTLAHTRHLKTGFSLAPGRRQSYPRQWSTDTRSCRGSKPGTIPTPRNTTQRRTPGGIWAAFINKWVKLKQEASGYPKGCDTPVERSEYVTAWKRRECIELELGKISHNLGLRSLAKLLAYSHWGKFGAAIRQVQGHLHH